MPRLKDINKVLVIGSGPIVIGQAAEFDYAGTQACRALKEEGFTVVLINSNPATIMTDLNIADRVYIEPLTPESVAAIIKCELPDGLLPTLGGQTGLNLAVALAEKGVLAEYGVRLLGTSLETIKRAEDRELFKQTMLAIGEPVPPSRTVGSVAEAVTFAEEIGYPVIVRPAYTLGGTGGGLAADRRELEFIADRGLKMSMIGQVLIEKSVAGWKEIEYEVMRDGADNCITICNMENIDPIGIHTGDSIVVAPSQTLSDKEYQMLRASALKIIRALKVEGGCNVQFALDPESFQYYVIEVNPRVSRSSALASKATGYPIARCAAKIAVGFALDEIPNPVTGKTCACFEPSIDYVVVKIPRWPFDKFNLADRTLGTQMKATGEVMALGRSFEEALLKAVRSLEIGVDGLTWRGCASWSEMELQELLRCPNDLRLFALAEAFRRFWPLKEVYNLTKIDYFFLEKIKNIVVLEGELRAAGWENMSGELLLRAKRTGFADSCIARLAGCRVEDVRQRRQELEITPVYKMVDTCAAEFEAATPYYYSTYELSAAAVVVESSGDNSGSNNRSGSGNDNSSGFINLSHLDSDAVDSRRGTGEPQKEETGLEFDVNLDTDQDTDKDTDTNTSASTDADIGTGTGTGISASTGTSTGTSTSTSTSTGKSTSLSTDCCRLQIMQDEVRAGTKKKIMVIGSGPIRIGQGIEFDYCSVHAVWAIREMGYEAVIVNNNPETVSTDFDTADRLYFEPLTLEDVWHIIEREQVAGVLVQFGGQTAINLAAGLAARGAPLLGTPLASIDIAEDREKFARFLRELNIPQSEGGTAFTVREAVAIAERLGYPVLVRPSYVLGGRAMEIVYNTADLMHYMETAVQVSPQHPVLVDKYIPGREVEVDAIGDGRHIFIPGIMEHIERAGVHSGDSMAVYPPVNLSAAEIEQVVDYTLRIGKALGICGLINIQYVIAGGKVYVLEVNPRASRTVPVLSKVTGVPMVKAAVQAILGRSLPEQGYGDGLGRPPGCYAVKAPVFSFEKLNEVEISLGPEMKSTGEVMGVDPSLTAALYKAMLAAGVNFNGGGVLLSLADRDKPEGVELAQRLNHLGFRLLATPGTARVLRDHGLTVQVVEQIEETVRSGAVGMVINTPTRGKHPARKGFRLRRLAADYKVSCFTALDTARAAVEVLAAIKRGELIKPLEMREYWRVK